MSDEKQIIVVGGGNGAGKRAALKAALLDFFGDNNCAATTITTSNVEDLQKDVILYKAPPMFKESGVIYNPKEVAKRKGKTPRKKQNGYF